MNFPFVWDAQESKLELEMALFLFFMKFGKFKVSTWNSNIL
jgi:hypothetical protein